MIVNLSKPRWSNQWKCTLKNDNNIIATKKFDSQLEALKWAFSLKDGEIWEISAKTN